MLPTDVVHSPLEGAITIWHCAAYAYNMEWPPQTLLHYPPIFALLGPTELHKTILKSKNLTHLIQLNPLIPQRIARTYPYFWRVANRSLYIATSTGIVIKTINPITNMAHFHFNPATAPEYATIVKRATLRDPSAKSRLKAAEKICHWFADTDLSSVYLQLDLP